MTTLVIGPNDQATIAALVAQATANPLPYVQLLRLVNGGPEVAQAVRDFNSSSTIDFSGYRITYTHEEQKPGRIFRHMSVSLPGTRLPSPRAVEALMWTFGFAKPLLQECKTWIETLEHDRKAVNVLQSVNGEEND